MDCVENQSHGSSKVLMLKSSLICPECQSELDGIYFERIMSACDIMSDFVICEEDNEFLDNQIPIQPMNITKKLPEKKNNIKQLPTAKKSESININNVYNKITKRIIGQDDAIKLILSTIFRNHMSDTSYTKSNIFLIGGTGNGKSETVKQIAKELQIPYVLEDASKYTQEGYVGESVENAINKLILEAQNDIVKAEHGIIIFDEIDKKTSNGEQSGVATTSVQDSLLKMLEGATFHTTQGKISTENITFILIGACENTYEERKKRLSNKGKIGFGTDNAINSELKNPNFIPEDLINSGFKSELIGRIDTIQEFKPMDVEMARQIIENSEISIFNLYLAELKKLGVEVIMNRNEVVEKISQRAVELKTGARAIRQIVVEMFKEIYAEILLSNKLTTEIYYCHISGDTVRDNTKYKLCKKEQEH